MTEKLCRLCLRKEGEFFELFHVQEGENLKLADEINENLDIQIFDDVRLPSTICSNCYQIHIFFKDFRLSCLKVNNYLIEQLKVSEDGIAINGCKSINPIIKSEKYCYRGSSDKDGDDHSYECDEDEFLNQKTENFGKSNNIITVNQNHVLRNLDFRSESVGTLRSLSYFNNDTNNEDFQNQEEEDMPPLIRVDILQQITKLPREQFSDGNEVIITPKEVYTSSDSQDCVMDEENIKTCVKEATSKIVQAADSCEENSSKIVWMNLEELPIAQRFVSNTTSSHCPSEDVTDDMNDDRDLCAKEGEISSENFLAEDNSDIDPSTNANGYELKQEEIILSESDYDDESLSENIDLPHEPDVLDELLVADTAEVNCSIVTVEKVHPSIDEYVIKKSDKIRSCGLEFVKAILNMLFDMQEIGVMITPTIIKKTALKVAATHDLKDFTATNGWLISFLKRCNIESKIGNLRITPECLQINSLSSRYLIRYCCDDLNRATFEVCCDLLSTGVDLSGNLIRDIALKIAIKEGLLEFTGSVGWLNAFKKKYKIALRGNKSPLKHKKKTLNHWQCFVDMEKDANKQLIE